MLMVTICGVKASVERQDRKKGIWRIPVDEIDRPGSFASHMNRSIVLLLEVLSKLKDHDTLLKVSFMLQRTPDQGKKYLRDVDRQLLAKRAFFLNVKVLEDNLNSLTGVQLSKAATASMGEMTTTAVSNRPSSEDSKHALPKKAGLTEVSCTTNTGPKDTTQAQITPPAISTDKGSKVENLLGKVDLPGSEGPRTRQEEPMDLESGHWRKATTATDTQGRKSEVCTSLGLMDSQHKAPDISRTSELSLEELSISSRQQQLQSAAAKVTITDQGLIRRPNRKRKLLEDVESGKTLLLDAYRVWQQGQKVMTYDLGRIEKIMSETYMLIKQVDEDVALDQAVKFCQIQLATSTQRQTAGDAPSTPKYSRDLFFPASLPTPVLISHATCQPLSTQDGQAKVVFEPLSKLSRPQTSGFHDQSVHRRAVCHPASAVAAAAAAAAMSFLQHTEEREEPTEGLLYRQQESHLCQQMKLATVSQVQETAAGWFREETATCSSSSSTTQHCADQQQYASGDQSKLPDPNRVRSRVPPNMPKLFIPATLTKFPPEITVTPPTPTLLSPKGSISEETKQKLKSAATVKKDSLIQPSLDLQDTSSQESSLESESDEEDDYMDI
ncbi:calcineurin-binding protein cabin-1-like isoform X2 [Nerophis ophidion]|uniref:calcineurin-binding protein cabin-1-like isoform X2 n=1 Tax=Nerophis ophidion TaxID=159077 RepID=UPI002ADF81BB|nr:calcineurin-binding protein cabin-1-like isoform X2 [Nerophis ophidion]